MDEVLLKNWNATVQPQDTIYILGDLLFRNAVPANEFLQQLNCKKHLLIGNHDKSWMNKADLSRYFESVERMMEISYGSHKITLYHYPMMTWNGVTKHGYMIHGHIHNNTEADYFSLIRKLPNLLNAGVEINNYKPVSFNDLLKNNIKFKGSGTIHNSSSDKTNVI